MARERAAQIEGYIDCCVRLEGGPIVIAGWAYHPAGDLDVTVIVEGAPVTPTYQEVIRGQRPDASSHVADSSGTPLGVVVLLQFDDPPPSAAAVTVCLASNAAEKTFDLNVTEGSFQQVLQRLRSFTDEQRRDLIHAARKLPGVVVPVEGSNGEVGEKLEDLDSFIRACLETALLIEGKGAFVQGWLFDPDGALSSAQLRCGDEITDDLLPTIGRFHRTDVHGEFPDRTTPGQEWGIVAFAPLEVTEPLKTIDLVVTTRDGQVGTYTAPFQRAARRPEALLGALVANFAPSAPGAFQLLERHVGPAIAAAWEARKQSQALSAEVLDFGRAPSQPRFSVVVPLYGRYDFVRYQVSEFCRDEDFAHTELVYVVDDPRIHAAVLELCRHTFELFQLPFRVVYAGRNLGYAGANNLGVKYCTADYLVLLNSDVLPKSRGWLSRLARQFECLESPGVLGTRLLFHDESIQHDGIAFRTHPGYGGIWLNEHPGKGLPRWLAPSPETAEVDAVTGACLMIKRALYESLGGLDEAYVIGDFEDTDLCLRVRAAGHRCYVARGEELYHLERQSMSQLGHADWRERIMLYNAWRHQKKWQLTLQSLTNGTVQ